MIYSFHPGTGGVAMCDGSARMLSENISVVVFCNMMSFRGHEVVSDTICNRRISRLPEGTRLVLRASPEA